VANQITYRYAAFSRDRSGLYGPAATASAAVRDTVPPPPPASFEAEARDRDIVLRWTNADRSDLVGTFIVFSTEETPRRPEDGAPLPSPLGGHFPGEPAANDSFVHRGLEDGRTYRYAAFSYDAVPNFSAGLVDSTTTPRDETPPDLALGLFPNPYLLYYLDIYLLASEPLDPESVSVRAARPVPMTLADAAEDLWAGKSRIPTSGVVAIEATATDEAGNRAETFGSLSLATGRKGEAVALEAPDGLLALRVPAGAVEDEAVFYIIPALWGPPTPARETTGKGPAGGAVRVGQGAYTLLSAGTWPSRGVEVEIRIDPAAWGDVPAEEIALEHSADGVLGLFIGEDRCSGAATIRSPGTVRLARDPGAPSRVAAPAFCRLLPNAPNPFNPSTVLRFEVGSPGPVRLAIHTVSGRLVRVVFDGQALPGTNEAVWDGLGTDGAAAGSGVYLLRLETERASETRRVVLLR
jgi:hypothetical protein